MCHSDLCLQCLHMANIGLLMMCSRTKDLGPPPRKLHAFLNHTHMFQRLFLFSCFQQQDRRGILDLLGVRKTVGTKDLWPPPRKLLEACFVEPHSYVFIIYLLCLSNAE